MKDKNKAKILIVDDETVNLRVLLATLPDYECLVAKDGEKALKLATSASPPDLILLDVIMPDPDGYEVFRRLKDNPATRHIPVIFITAKGNTHEESLGLEMGAVDYIAKPFSPVVVRARVGIHVKLKQQMDLLERLNVTDQLTGISNRRCFDEAFAYEWQAGCRSQLPLSIVLIDIDRFKFVNDLGGHLYGDECLQKIAQLLHRCVNRSQDLVARYGGEEFIALLPNTHMKDAQHIAEQMRLAVLDEAIDFPEEEGSVTVSSGLATCIPSTNLEPADLIELADRKLYEAKTQGRNRVCT